MMCFLWLKGWKQKFPVFSDTWLTNPWSVMTKDYLPSMHLRRAELGHSLGSFRDSVLGKFSRKHQSNCRLDFTRRKSRLLVVSGKLSGLSGNALKDIVNERVHDGHSLLRDTSVRVNLLQHLVDVRRVRLDSLLVLAATSSLLGRGGFFGSLA